MKYKFCNNANLNSTFHFSPCLSAAYVVNLVNTSISRGTILYILQLLGNDEIPTRGGEMCGEGKTYLEGRQEGRPSLAGEAGGEAEFGGGEKEEAVLGYSEQIEM